MQLLVGRAALPPLIGRAEPARAPAFFLARRPERRLGLRSGRMGFEVV